MAQKRNAARRRHRRRRDTTGIILRLIVFALIAFIIGLVVWFVLHDRDLRSGISALKKEQYEEAIMCFDDSIAEDKNVAECWRGKGMAYYEMKDYKKAVRCFKTALEEGGKIDAQFCNLVALSYINQKKYKPALRWLQEGLAQTDASDELIMEMRYQQVLCYEKTAQWDLARENAESYTSDYPDDQKMIREYRFLQTR
ncbi:MAG: tetratricopeptide repeat protein [Lachnospiraceae bacterium]|nr:tetratricopeptide repeat protein [Lachnospiraceae bacterium]